MQVLSDSEADDHATDGGDDPFDAGAPDDATEHHSMSDGSPMSAADEAEFERIRVEEAEQLARIRNEHLEEDDAVGRQRRQNVRVDVQLPIRLQLAGREAPGRTRDVSATGVGFATRLPVELEQRGEVTVEFDGWQFRKAFIVRFVKPILAGSQVGVQFDELTQEEREKLVKQVFDVQRSQLQDSRRR